MTDTEPVDPSASDIEESEETNAGEAAEPIESADVVGEEPTVYPTASDDEQVFNDATFQADAFSRKASGEQAQIQSTRGWFSAMLRLLAQASVIGIVVAVALAAVTIFLDDRRADRQQTRDFEATWRTNLFAGAEYPGAVLSNLDLTGLYAGDIDLSAAKAENINLSQATLIDARFDAAYLIGADFTDARLRGVSFRWADLRDASFERAYLRGADFRDAQLQGTSLMEAFLQKADVRGTDLSQTVLPDGAGDSLCWDEATTWPSGMEIPTVAQCSPDQAHEPGSLAERWLVDAMVARADTGVTRWLDEVDVGPGDVVKGNIMFMNEGVVPVENVKIVVQLFEQNEADGALVFIADTVILFNGNYPTGYNFPASAAQGGGRMINVDIGDYGAGMNAFVTFEMTVDVDHPAVQCGVHDLGFSAYATPSERGSISNAIVIRYDSGVPCS